MFSGNANFTYVPPVGLTLGNPSALSSIFDDWIGPPLSSFNFLEPSIVDPFVVQAQSGSSDVSAFGGLALVTGAFTAYGQSSVAFVAGNGGMGRGATGATAAFGAVTAAELHAFYAYNPFFDGGATATFAAQFYSKDLGPTVASIVNPYYLWFDSRGVLRVREDNTFDGVYQAIQALYNPQFIKYTPGAENHERGILGQWSANIFQVGVEKGGTGTLRQMDFIGAGVGFPLSDTNGQKINILSLTELTTIAAAATTDTAIQIPANAVVFGVDVRVTVAIPTAATFTVIGAGSATVFNTAAVAVAANTTNSGTKSCPFYNATAQAIRITPDVQPAANTGRVRVTIHYYTVTPATS